MLPIGLLNFCLKRSTLQFRVQLVRFGYDWHQLINRSNYSFLVDQDATYIQR